LQLKATRNSTDDSETGEGAGPVEKYRIHIAGDRVEDETVNGDQETKQTKTKGNDQKEGGVAGKRKRETVNALKASHINHCCRRRCMFHLTDDCETPLQPTQNTPQREGHLQIPPPSASCAKHTTHFSIEQCVTTRALGYRLPRVVKIVEVNKIRAR
jgi:hypothetical protein